MRAARHSHCVRMWGVLPVGPSAGDMGIPCIGVRVWGLGFKVLGFRVLGFRVQGSRFKV